MRAASGRKRASRSIRLGWAALLAALGCGAPGCTGDIDAGDPLGPPGTTRVVAEDDRLPPRVWRLTGAQIDTELVRMFGDGAPAIGLPATASQHNLDNIAENAGIDDGNVTLLIDGARVVATWVVAHGDTATRCGSTWGTPACVDSFLAWFPAEAYRRTPSDGEITELRTLFTDLDADYEYELAFAAVVRAVLMSPEFLYRTELGASPTPLAAGARATMTGDEIANLIAFAITDAPPDDELRAAAGSLQNPDERERQVRRLVARSSPVWRQFFWQWLHLGSLRSQGTEVGLSGTVVDQMEEEYGAFLDDVVVANDGTFEDVFSANHTFVRPELADVYGVTHPGGGLARVELDATQRGGLFTMGAWLVSHGKRGKDNVVRRGMGIYRDAMCNEIVPPPGLDVASLQAQLEMSANPTVRESVEARGSAGVCANCHHTADPVGLAFENYTSDGRWQTIYPDGRPVEAMIELPGVGTFDTAPTLSLALTQSGRFRSCFLQRFANFVVGAEVGTPATSVWLRDTATSFSSHDDRLTELLVALVRHPAFVEREN